MQELAINGFIWYIYILMKKKLFFLLKISGFVLFYFMVLFLSVFLTMRFLIKGEETIAPDLAGKSLNEAYRIAEDNGLYLKKILGNYDRNYKPLTVISQVPAAGIRIKEKSFVKIYVSSDLVEVIVPDLAGYNLAECEKILQENDLRKRYISYMDAQDVPVDFVISQSYPAGAKVPAGSDIDILVSKGQREVSYIMPNVIAAYAPKVLAYFENRGLKISNITKTSYPGVESDKIIKQYPLSGYRINSRARITIEVSE